jgi:hypothetical protein
MKVDSLATHALQLHKRILKISWLANRFTVEISRLIRADDPRIRTGLCDGCCFDGSKAQRHGGNPFIWEGAFIHLGSNHLKRKA